MHFDTESFKTISLKQGSVCCISPMADLAYKSLTLPAITSTTKGGHSGVAFNWPLANCPVMTIIKSKKKVVPK